MNDITGADILNRLSSSSEAQFLNVNVITSIDISLAQSRMITIDFTGSTFQHPFSLFAPGGILKLIFDGCIFHSNIRIENTSGSSDISFLRATINSGLEVSSYGKTVFTFDNASWKGKIILEKLDIVGSFQNMNLIESNQFNKFSLTRSKFSQNISFAKSELQNVDFQNCEFQKDFIFLYAKLLNTNSGFDNFKNVSFNGQSFFNNTLFENQVSFNQSIFEDSVSFTDSKLNKNCHVDFSGVCFKKRVFFDYSLFKSMVFNNSEFKDMASFQYLKVEQLIISRVAFFNGANFLNATIAKSDRETFQVIKHEFEKLNNKVEVLNYQAREMIAYERELNIKSKRWDFVLLKLNRISNKHGLSWSRGVLFTLSCGIIFFAAYIFSLNSLPFKWGWQNFNSFYSASGIIIKYFIRFLIITHDLDFMQNYQPTALSFLIDFLGKVFIGYGIYQTIQAFRKYGKG